MRRHPWTDLVMRREVQCVVIGGTEEREADFVDVLLAQRAAKAKHVLSPIEIAVDQKPRGIASGDDIEVGEIVGMRKRGNSNLCRDERNSDFAHTADQSCRRGKHEWHIKRQYVAHTDIQ